MLLFSTRFDLSMFKQINFINSWHGMKVCCRFFGGQKQEFKGGNCWRLSNKMPFYFPGPYFSCRRFAEIWRPENPLFILSPLFPFPPSFPLPSICAMHSLEGRGGRKRRSGKRRRIFLLHLVLAKTLLSSTCSIARPMEGKWVYRRREQKHSRRRRG